VKLIAAPPLLIILGPTASGKSGLAHPIARSRNDSSKRFSRSTAF